MTNKTPPITYEGSLEYVDKYGERWFIKKQRTNKQRVPNASGNKHSKTVWHAYLYATDKEEGEPIDHDVSVSVLGLITHIDKLEKER